jgi:hypothetical protein
MFHQRNILGGVIDGDPDVMGGKRLIWQDFADSPQVFPRDGGFCTTSKGSRARVKGDRSSVQASFLSASGQ